MKSGMAFTSRGLIPTITARRWVKPSHSACTSRSHASGKTPLPAAGRSGATGSRWLSESSAAALAGVTLDDFHAAVNHVAPSLIRVQADEVTYNLHIIVRFELEQALLSGDLPTAELPTAWNQKYEDVLGLKPGNDAEGCLQDIHWMHGLIGYFPTYTLGNLYAAQFFAQAQSESGGLDASLRHR